MTTRTPEEITRETIQAIQRADPNGVAATDAIAHQLGYRPARHGRLAVTARLRKAERDGLVGRIPPRDQWASAHWFVTIKGRGDLAAIRAKEPTR